MSGPIPPYLPDLMFGKVLAKFDDVVIPGIARCEIDRDHVADTSSTASGKRRFDFVVSKRVWQVETTFLPMATLESIESYLENEKYWGWGDWWCWRMGNDPNNTVRARIDEWRDHPLDRRPDLWSVSFTVVEQ